MKLEELKEIIRNGESSKIEFTLDSTKPNELAKEIVALANFQGGMIIIGVRDDKSIEGIKRPKLEEWVMNICRNNIEPPIIPGYEEVVIEDKRVAIISLPYTKDKPYAVTKSGRLEHYIRVGTTSRGATREELRRLYQAGGLLQFDKTPVLNCLPQELDMKKITDYYKKFYNYELNKMSDEEKLKLLLNAGLLTKSDKEDYFSTVAGVLLFGNNPTNWLPQSGITFANFEGLDLGSGRLINTEDFTSVIPENIERVCDYIRKIVPRPAKIVKCKRIEKEIYPYEVIREALVNASVHRDYTISAKIRVFLFNNRLEIRSPGRLPNAVTIEEIKIGKSSIRNPLLFQFMHSLGYGDRLGQGIPFIIHTMKSLGAKEPDIKENGEVTLIIYSPQ